MNGHEPHVPTSQDKDIYSRRVYDFDKVFCKKCLAESFILPCPRTPLTLQTMMDCIMQQQAVRGVHFADMSPEARKAYASENALALFVEVGELVSSWPFASWKTTPLDRANLAREIVDCFFFLSNIAACFNLSAEDLGEKFSWVLENNYNRINSGEHKEVVIK